MNNKLKYNPFHDAGITNYEQFSLYPFLIFGALETINNRVQQKITEIKEGYNFPERLILLGDRGIGKTSTLFFIKRELDRAGIRAELFSRLFDCPEQIEELSKKVVAGEGTSHPLIERPKFYEMIAKPIYFLVDFPDAVDAKTFRKFLEFLWSLFTHKNYNKINLIFAMNKSHYTKAFDYGDETLGKFQSLRLEKLNDQEARDLICSRLEKAEGKTDEIFEEEVLEVIFSYSKGIPRNIVSACCLLVDNSNSKKITKKSAEKVLKERYLDQVINDRVEDLDLKRIYRQMTKILEDDFKGSANSQEDYVKKVMGVCNIGRNSALSRINDLIKFGIFNQYKGGYNRVNKIISFN